MVRFEGVDVVHKTGEELFIGQMDNTDIPKRIAKVMGMEGVLD